MKSTTYMSKEKSTDSASPSTLFYSAKSSYTPKRKQTTQQRTPATITSFDLVKNYYQSQLLKLKQQYNTSPIKLSMFVLAPFHPDKVLASSNDKRLNTVANTIYKHLEARKNTMVTFQKFFSMISSHMIKIVWSCVTKNKCAYTDSNRGPLACYRNLSGHIWQHKVIRRVLYQLSYTREEPRAFHVLGSAYFSMQCIFISLWRSKEKQKKSSAHIENRDGTIIGHDSEDVIGIR